MHDHRPQPTLHYREIIRDPRLLKSIDQHPTNSSRPRQFAANRPPPTTTTRALRVAVSMNTEPRQIAAEHITNASPINQPTEGASPRVKAKRRDIKKPAGVRHPRRRSRSTVRSHNVVLESKGRCFSTKDKIVPANWPSGNGRGRITASNNWEKAP